MARSQLRLAVARWPPDRAAAARMLLTSASALHSRYQDSSSAGSTRLAASQHSETVAPPSCALPNSLVNSSDRSSRSGQQIPPLAVISPIMTKTAATQMAVQPKTLATTAGQTTSYASSEPIERPPSARTESCAALSPLERYRSVQ